MEQRISYVSFSICSKAMEIGIKIQFKWVEMSWFKFFCVQVMYIKPFSNYFLFSGCGISLQKQIAQRRIVGGDDAGFGNFFGYLIFYAAVISCNKNIIEF